MTDTIADLERRLVIARKAEEERIATSCKDCNGVGWVSYMKFDRTKFWIKCPKCHGTGWKEAYVDDALWKTFGQYAKPNPTGKQP